MKSETLNINIKNKNTSYPILIGENLLENIYGIINSYFKFGQIVVIVNSTVYELYGKSLKLPCKFIITDDGEAFKSFKTYCEIQDKLMEYNPERKDCIIALGGGVTGDIAGFVAATYKRGINLIQVPTTLLAQVDSSVGGKVAINHERGKNLIGAFYQPKLVLADIGTLRTLDIRQLKSGLGEVLKYAFIEKTCNKTTDTLGNQSLIDFLYENKKAIYNCESEILSILVKRCCELKSAVVEADEKENGIRAILNFGHTFAHAIEQCTSYSVFTHGEAVSIGLKMALELSYEKKFISREYFKKAVELIDFYELSRNLTENPLVKISAEDFTQAISHDKKCKDNNVQFILSNGVGQCSIQNTVEKEEIKRIFIKYAK